jgi:hypothetical protein
MMGYAPRIAGEVLSWLGSSAGSVVMAGVEVNLKIAATIQITAKYCGNCLPLGFFINLTSSYLIF